MNSDTMDDRPAQTVGLVNGLLVGLNLRMTAILVLRLQKPSKVDAHA
jgi:hypothetical protein